MPYHALPHAMQHIMPCHAMPCDALYYANVSQELNRSHACAAENAAKQAGLVNELERAKSGQAAEGAQKAALLEELRQMTERAAEDEVQKRDLIHSQQRLKQQVMAWYSAWHAKAQTTGDGRRYKHTSFSS